MTTFAVGDKVVCLRRPEKVPSTACADYSGPIFNKEMDKIIGVPGEVIKYHYTLPSDRARIKFSHGVEWTLMHDWLVPAGFGVGDVVTCHEKPSDNDLYKHNMDFPFQMRALMGKPGRISNIEEDSIYVKYANGEEWVYLPHWLTLIENNKGANVPEGNHHVGEVSNVNVLGGLAMFTIGSVGKTTEGKSYEVVKMEVDTFNGKGLVALIGDRDSGYNSYVLKENGRTFGDQVYLLAPTGNINNPASRQVKVGDSGKTSDDKHTWKVLAQAAGTHPFVTVLDEGTEVQSLVHVNAAGQIKSFTKYTLIKPVVQKTGWLNFYEDGDKLQPSRAIADQKAAKSDKKRTECVKVTFYEGQMDC